MTEFSFIKNFITNNMYNLKRGNSITEFNMKVNENLHLFFFFYLFIYLFFFCKQVTKVCPKVAFFYFQNYSTERECNSVNSDRI